VGAPWWSLLLTAVVALAVGWFGREATIGAARISAGVEGEKLRHDRNRYAAERRDKAKADFFKAIEAMGMATLGESALPARIARAAEARIALLSVEWTLGRAIGGPRFDELLQVLATAVTEDQLDTAAGIWPEVEQAIRNDPPLPRAKR
jgi:hypothetical protein